MIEIPTTCMIRPLDMGPWSPTSTMRMVCNGRTKTLLPFPSSRGGISVFFFASPSHLLFSYAPYQFRNSKPDPLATVSIHHSLFSLSGEDPLDLISEVRGLLLGRPRYILNAHFGASDVTPRVPSRRYPATLRIFDHLGVHLWIHRQHPLRC